MNWEIIGVFAEIIGAGAVVVTLAYLAVQIRLGREASQVQSSYSALEVYGNWRSHLIENDRLAAIVAKANRGEAIRGAEDVQIATLMDDLFLTSAISHGSGKSNVLYGSSVEAEYLERIFRQNPGLAPYWNRTRDYLSSLAPEFVNQVDAQLADKSFPYLSDEKEKPDESATAN
jgi:hypothetical protein